MSSENAFSPDECESSPGHFLDARWHGCAGWKPSGNCPRSEPASLRSVRCLRKFPVPVAVSRGRKKAHELPVYGPVRVSLMPSLRLSSQPSAGHAAPAHPASFPSHSTSPLSPAGRARPAPAAAPAPHGSAEGVATDRAGRGGRADWPRLPSGADLCTFCQSAAVRGRGFSL